MFKMWDTEKKEVPQGKKKKRHPQKKTKIQIKPPTGTIQNGKLETARQDQSHLLVQSQKTIPQGTSLAESRVC